MKKSFVLKEAFIGNQPIFKSRAVNTPELEESSANSASLKAMIENTPKLQSSEVLVINVRV